MKDPRIYLLHVQECIARIERYTSGGRQAFLGSEITQDAVLRNLQTIGQSIARVPPEITATRPDVDWRSIVGFRNVLVHDYLGVNLARVWEIPERDLPVLKLAIHNLLLNLEGAP